MGKNDDLKQRLKAASRRRSRRLSGAATGISDAAMDSSSSNQVDAAGMVVSAILVADENLTLQDSDVIAALRACSNTGSTSTPPAQELLGRLKEIANRDDVSSRRFQDAIKNVLSTALSMRKADHNTAFLQYLSVLAS